MKQVKNILEWLKTRRNKISKLSLFLLIAIGLTVGVTLAFQFANTGVVKNFFKSSSANIKVVEEFDGIEKTNINVEVLDLPESTDVYVRVKLVSYRVNDDGNRIGGTAELPNFTLGENWVKYESNYYYTLPVAPGSKPATNLTNIMTLVEYDDVDGGKQVVEVMAEAIQSDSIVASQQAWNVTISENNVEPYIGS